MASINEFVTHMADVFSAFGPFEVRRVFARRVRRTIPGPSWLRSPLQ